MISDEEKKEMLKDASSESRRQAFSQLKKAQTNKSVTGVEFLAFLQSVQHIFPHNKPSRRPTGTIFKL